MKTYTLEELEDKYIGKEGTEKRTQYENELALELLKEKSFWENLKVELDNREYFCHSSELFDRLWNNTVEFKKEITKLAKEFLLSIEDVEDRNFYTNCVVLFGSIPQLHYNKIRVQFCNYMINKLKDGTTV